jgi:hypothetical protein
MLPHPVQSIPTLTIYPFQYQLALHQIDSLRKDGKFVGSDGSIPEGQGIVMAHLSECHELVEMVRMSTLFLPLFMLKSRLA